MLLSPAADIAARFPGVPGLASVRRSACVPAWSAALVDRTLVYTSVSEAVPALGCMASLAW